RPPRRSELLERRSGTGAFRPMLDDRLAHCQTLELSKIQFEFAVLHPSGSSDLSRQQSEKLFVQIHQVLVIAVRFVKLQHSNSGLCCVEIPSFRKLRLIS